MCDPIAPTPRPAGRRPAWDSYFLGLAFVASRRSLDPSTKHGCVIVDKNRHVVATGYNSFPAGMRDEDLPVERPAKYIWMEHAERNALANATRSLHDAGATAFVTGRPCFECLKSLWRHGVRRVVYAGRRGFTAAPPGEQENSERLIRETGMSVEVVYPDLSWLFDDGLRADLRSCGLLGADPSWGPPFLSR